MQLDDAQLLVLTPTKERVQATESGFSHTCMHLKENRKNDVLMNKTPPSKITAWRCCRLFCVEFFGFPPGAPVSSNKPQKPAVRLDGDSKLAVCLYVSALWLNGDLSSACPASLSMSAVFACSCQWPCTEYRWNIKKYIVAMSCRSTDVCQHKRLLCWQGYYFLRDSCVFSISL